MKRIAYLALAGALVALAACQQTPEAKINAACVRDGGLTAQPGQPRPAAAEVKRQCDCFSNNLKQSMTQQELKQLADAMSAPKKEGQDNVPPALAPKMMGAIKACALPS